MLAGTGVYLFPVKNANLTHAVGVLTAAVGAVSLTGYSASLKVYRRISPEVGSYSLCGTPTAIYNPISVVYILDNIAANAPAAPSFFEPVMPAFPALVLSPDEEFSVPSYPYSDIYLTYYTSSTNTWDDVAYEGNNNGELIPAGIKQAVADQVYLYSVYTLKIAEWNQKYIEESMYQWPYFWAKKVLARS